MNGKTLTVVVLGILAAGAVIAAGCIGTGGQAPEQTGNSVSPSLNTPVTATTAPGSPQEPAANALTCSRPATGTLTESKEYPLRLNAAEMLTRPTAHSVTVSMVPAGAETIFYALGTASGSFSCETPRISAAAGVPSNTTIGGLVPDTEYFYRACLEGSGTAEPACGPEHTFHTQRSPGSTFTFAVQADSHPEREKTMFNAELYTRTLQNVAGDHPDFFLTLGDDFSIDPLIDQNRLSLPAVNSVYLNQRKYLGIVGNSAPVFLVNGNHEDAARYLLDGTPANAAVFAGTARMQYFPQPVPDGFYTGDEEPVPYVGLPGDYYAWTWGDALFVVIDPYWHSDVAVDSTAGGKGHQKKDMWDITLGDAQYAWFKKTLEESNASYKFVFAHHVLGTGRGGIEEAGLYEWGGKNPRGADEFSRQRPGWEIPVQQLMAKNGVTIFFQGHDHLFARQELDGVTYQEVPLPADPSSSMFNADAYHTGDKLANSGYLRVTVSPQNTTVAYVRSYLPGQETAPARNGMVAYSYTLTGRGGGSVTV